MLYIWAGKIIYVLCNFQVLIDREKNAESRRENSMIVTIILADLEKGESELREALEAVSSSEVKGVEMTKILDDLAVRFQAAEKRLSEQASVVPQYDLRARQSALAALRERFRAIQDNLQPKKKFGFKGNKKKTAATAAKAESEAKKVLEDKKNGKSEVDFGCSVKDREGEMIELSADQVSGRDVLASGLRSCTVQVRGSASTLHLTGLTDCTVTAGPVATSVFVDGCRGCTFALACQQLRAHTTEDSDFYLHVTSGAIVEDCREARFAPLQMSYDGMDADYNSSGLDRSTNNYDKVISLKITSNMQFVFCRRCKTSTGWLPTSPHRTGASYPKTNERPFPCDLANNQTFF